jgi:hypothetical protein
VFFDGVNDVMALPSIANIRGVSLWLYLPPNFTTPPAQAFVLDAVSYVMDSHSLSTHALGSAFSHLYVDGELQGVTGVQPHTLFPSERWFHLHLEAAYAFHASLNIVSTSPFPIRPMRCLKSGVSLVCATLAAPPLSLSHTQRSTWCADGLQARHGRQRCGQPRRAAR